MSGIFVDSKERVEVTVHYKSKPEGKLEIMEIAEDGSESLTIKFAYPDYQTSQRIIQSSMKPSLEGGLSMDVFAMQQNMLIGLAREWDVKDNNGEPVPLTSMALGSLKVEIARALISKLMEQIGDLL